MKTEIFDQFERLGKGLASARRLELLDMLSQAPRTVEQLANLTGQSVANTSQHLKVLRGARLVDSHKRGLYVTYRVDEEVSAFFCAFRRLAASRLAEVERAKETYLNERGSMTPVDSTALLAKARNGAVTVLDVRPVEEFRSGHLPEAVSIPLPELERRLKELPTDREVVAYCRGPYCVLSVEAVETLRAHGFTATWMEDGVLEWAERGGRVERGGS